MKCWTINHEEDIDFLLEIKISETLRKNLKSKSLQNITFTKVMYYIFSLSGKSKTCGGYIWKYKE